MFHWTLVAQSLAVVDDFYQGAVALTVDADGEFATLALQSVLDGILNKDLYGHGRQVHLFRHDVWRDDFLVMQLVAHLPAFYLHIVVHKAQFLAERGLQHIGLVDAKAQQLREGTQVDRFAIHLCEHLVRQGIIDEMWRDAVADILHAQHDDLLLGGDFLQAMAATVQLVEHNGDDDNQQGNGQ